MEMVDDLLKEFKAKADIHGNRINLTWTWTAPGDRPDLRLLRRRRAYPSGPEDGLCVLELTDLFREPGQTWACVERTLYLGPNMAAESGLRHAEVTCYFTSPDAVEPAQIAVTYYDPVADAFQVVRLEEVTRIERTEDSVPPWEKVETLEIFATPGGGPEESVGQMVVFTGHEDGATPNRFEWIAPGQSLVSVGFHRMQVQETTVILDEAFNADTGEWRRRTTVEDMGLDPEVVYYYALFKPVQDSDEFHSERTWRALAMATGRYGLDERLYQLLPAILKQYDEPTPGRGNQAGQLRRFLQVFGAALDQIRSQAEGLRGRHDVLQVRADRLPHLARWIGWELDQTVDELAQREEILFAPELYRTVGTIPNLQALVNHITGWDCQIKEFVHNVFRSNAPETIRLWEVWEQRHDGTNWGEPASITQIEEGLDGRPAAAVDGGGVLWLFWHADRSGRREIWLQRLDGVDPTPRRAMLDTPDDAPDLDYTDENPAAVVDGARIWLFWNSDREESWDIWARPYDGLPGGAAVRLTEHLAEDRHPAAVCDGAGQIWVFWQSNRRGPTDIWARVHDGTDWGLPTRITKAQFRHEMPAAVVDGAGHIWLFYVADLGDRRNLYFQVFDGGVWKEPEPVTEGLQRDESPAAVFWDDQVWLFWHSNRDGRWQIWGRTRDGAAWDDPFPVTSHAAADKEPAAVEDTDGRLRVFWRSQRRGDLYKSRTIDVNDTEMLDRLGTFKDRAHYTYDTGLKNEDWYARDVVGLYLTPDTENAALIIRTRNPMEIVRQFLPIQVRAVLIIAPPVYRELIYTYDFPTRPRWLGDDEAFVERFITEQSFDSVIPESYFGLSDSYQDTVPDWVWLRTWSVVYPDHRTVDFTTLPIDTRFRTWHIGLEVGG